MIAVVKWYPAMRTLRQFGLVGMLAAAVLAGWTWWGNGVLWYRLTPATAGAAAGAFAVIAAIFGLLAWLRPQSLQPVYFTMNLLALPIRTVVSLLLLLTIFYGLLLPIGLVFRLLGHDPLRRSRRQSKANGDSCWQPRSQPASKARYYDQY